MAVSAMSVMARSARYTPRRFADRDDGYTNWAGRLSKVPTPEKE